MNNVETQNLASLHQKYLILQPKSHRNEEIPFPNRRGTDDGILWTKRQY